MTPRTINPSDIRSPPARVSPSSPTTTARMLIDQTVMPTTSARGAGRLPGRRGIHRQAAQSAMAAPAAATR